MIDFRIFIFVLVFGGVVVFAIAVTAIMIVSIATTSLIKEVRIKNESEKKLLSQRFDFEKQLALIKVRLDRNAQNAKSKADFAVQALSDLYEAKLLLEDARQKRLKDLRGYNDYRSVKHQLDEKNHLMHSLLAHRHAAFAFFGEEAASCYSNIIGLFEEVRNASRHLAQVDILDQTISAERREEYETLIWQQPSEADVIAVRLQEVMNVAHRVFGAALNTPFTENIHG